LKSHGKLFSSSDVSFRLIGVVDDQCSTCVGLGDDHRDKVVMLHAAGAWSVDSLGQMFSAFLSLKY